MMVSKGVSTLSFNICLNDQKLSKGMVPLPSCFFQYFYLTKDGFERDTFKSNAFMSWKDML